MGMGMGGMMPGMSGMMGQGMPMPMMGGMGMPMPMMGMPMMMPMMMRGPMMARMNCEMGKDGMVCRMMPMDSSQMEMMKECCDALNAMMAMGMPITLMCNGMPMMTMVMGK
jgi:hypothetical protein